MLFHILSIVLVLSSLLGLGIGAPVSGTADTPILKLNGGNGRLIGEH